MMQVLLGIFCKLALGVDGAVYGPRLAGLMRLFSQPLQKCVQITPFADTLRGYVHNIGH